MQVLYSYPRMFSRACRLKPALDPDSLCFNARLLKLRWSGSYLDEAFGDSFGVWGSGSVEFFATGAGEETESQGMLALEASTRAVLRCNMQ